jgi:hypothetical protein
MSSGDLRTVLAIQFCQCHFQTKGEKRKPFISIYGIGLLKSSHDACGYSGN